MDDWLRNIGLEKFETLASEKNPHLTEHDVESHLIGVNLCPRLRPEEHMELLMVVNVRHPSQHLYDW